MNHFPTPSPYPSGQTDTPATGAGTPYTPAGDGVSDTFLISMAVKSAPPPTTLQPSNPTAVSTACPTGPSAQPAKTDTVSPDPTAGLNTAPPRTEPASAAPRQLAKFARLLAESVLPLADWIAANRPGHGPRAARLRACAAVLAFRPLPGGGYCLAPGTRLCNQPRLCAVCASVRAARFARDYARRVALALHQHPNRRAYVVTLTRRPDPDLLSSVRA